MEDEIVIDVNLCPRNIRKNTFVCPKTHFESLNRISFCKSPGRLSGRKYLQTLITIQISDCSVGQGPVWQTSQIQYPGQASIGRRRPGRPGFSNNVFPFWNSWFLSKMFAHQEMPRMKATRDSKIQDGDVLWSPDPGYSCLPRKSRPWPSQFL